MSNVRPRNDPEVLTIETAHAETWKAREKAHNDALRERVGPHASYEPLAWDTAWSVVPEGSIPAPPFVPTAEESASEARIVQETARTVA
ncbi:MAG: hypothetical protein L3K01_06885, partial [Thermoplasmata archaeon]|nr:hypothetical protein [Thermoplasmata archaeon]